MIPWVLKYDQYHFSQFPYLALLSYVLHGVAGAALGFSYAQTRNLVTPITIHSLWNSGVIILLTFLQVAHLRLYCTYMLAVALMF